MTKYDAQVYGRRVGYYPTSEVFKNVRSLSIISWIDPPTLSTSEGIR